MKALKPPIDIKIVTGAAAEKIREYRFERARARIAAQIEEANLSVEEIMAEVEAFRKGV
ncbi:MAG: hypothetical protein OWR62_10455 [Sulfobacillus thermotolerans]|nr:hypothetical protein [Sulfobacillus thermotolerans]